MATVDTVRKSCALSPGLKWFGSLSNLSIRRSSDKTDPKITSKPDGSHSDKTLGANSVDDMDTCLLSPGYARSSDMYTHVGTVPRKEREKSSKGSKKKRSSKGQISGGQSQCQAGDYVRDSPLLSVLSSTHLSALEKPLPGGLTGKTLPVVQAPTHSPSPSCDTDTLPSRRGSYEVPKSSALNKPSGNQDPPLTCEDHSVVNAARTNPCVPDPATMPSSQSTQYYSDPVSPTALTKDLYEVMEPIAQVVRRDTEQKTQDDGSRTLGDSQRMGTFDCQLDPIESKGEYVKFSKERFWLDVPSEKLRRELEEELKLSSSNLLSHGWYHGHIPWEVSETLVLHHGDFLIRDSLSSLEDYVLTNRWNQNTLHFLISKVLLQTSETYTRVQYTLEGEAFDSVPALVHFYVGNRMVLTQQSGAQIHSPVNRTLPLHYLEAAFALANHKGSLNSPSCQKGALVKTQSGNGMDKICPLSPSTVHHRGAVRSCSFNLDQIEKIHQPSSPIGENLLSSPFITQQPRSPRVIRVPEVAPSPSVSRRSSSRTQPCPSPSPSPNNNTQHTTRAQASPTHIYLTPDTDSSYSQLCPATPPAQSYVKRLCTEEEEGQSVVDPVKEENVYEVPIVETASAFRPSRYQSPLMPKENRPLEVGVLRRIKELLAQVDAKTAAKHITKADCMVARILNVTPEMQRKMGVSSGMELLTLPHGHQLRLDLLERFQTMSIMLAVEVLGCTGSTEERASLLHKTIQMAAELKSNLGNMFGFAAIMRTLELPQICRLEQTWMVLRQRHTEGAILYEKTLKPFMKRMNDGKESGAFSNTSFPHVVPLLSLLEKSVAVADGAEPWETVEAGMDVVMSHLAAARTMAQLGGNYCANAEKKLQGFQEQAEVLELFLTEFQMRLLWGSRGAEENQAERYTKFDQVLTALSNKLEPPHSAQ
ncbi:SH2 domain-containing protein 3C-like isoform 2-T2 [Salvelinus alpinus]